MTCFFPPPSATVMNVKKQHRPNGAKTSWSRATRCRAGIVLEVAVRGKRRVRRANHLNCRGVMMKP